MIHSPTENMETLGFARGEAHTQMADVMKQMNWASDQSTITPTKDCHPINLFIQLNIFNIIYSYHTFFCCVTQFRHPFQNVLQQGSVLCGISPHLANCSESSRYGIVKISQEMFRDLAPDLFDTIIQLLFSCRRIYIHFVFHPKPNVFNDIQVRTLGRPRENHDST